MYFIVTFDDMEGWKLILFLFVSILFFLSNLNEEKSLSDDLLGLVVFSVIFISLNDEWNVLKIISSAIIILSSVVKLVLLKLEDDGPPQQPTD